MAEHLVRAVDDYGFTSQDKLFLDANIWLFVYGANKPDDSKVKVYSQSFKRIMNAGCQIYIDVLVVSELINRYSRTKCNLVNNQTAKNFKDFRKSRDFARIAEEVADMMRRVLKHCKRIKSGFETLRINALIDEYAEGKSDFNDQVIAAICKRERLKLVTDDGDFKGQGIPILTANKRLLN